MNFCRFFQLSGLAFFCSALFSCTNDPWEPLFNGEDLEGWTVKCISADQGKVYWSVKDACITCNSLGDKEHNYVWLATDREFTDFHLKLKFQIFKESGETGCVAFQLHMNDELKIRFKDIYIKEFTQ